MIERIIDLSDNPARLSIHLEQLVIESGDQKNTVPMEEVGVLVVSNPAVTYTQAVLSGLMEHGGVFLACSMRRLPIGMMVSLEGHHLQTERLHEQIEASEPVRKRVWQQLVQSKIVHQARVLVSLHNKDYGLIAMSGRVNSGDTDNVEGQAARKYWPLLFGDLEFRRDPDAGSANSMLNYGYGVLRGIVARAVVAAGLHPSIGVHHHNRYDAYCLADDMMEPFRPLVDKVVANYVRDNGEPAELGKNEKRVLIEALLARHMADGELRTLFDITARTAVSLMHLFQGKRKTLVLPDW
ncbi:MAG TPA: type II CRISPR-associated endonuclease Cas1 [Candidatus Hydrogenedentes bacterium]|nr:type II CRISPR-associated endonuclease Cas1 [Candidatus Hydrogenedentota bacterium]